MRSLTLQKIMVSERNEWCSHHLNHFNALENVWPCEKWAARLIGMLCLALSKSKIQNITSKWKKVDVTTQGEKMNTELPPNW